ncbi:histidine phosphatase family protein, partial [Pseudomonas sp. 2822-17]|uniref:histidine phosphatase family protein n=1 Tax=Pseudomonas sp. 2822-17 TaxID=1712678 RepID=UPI00117B79E5
SSYWDVIITSPLKRAKETAEVINESLKVSLIQMNDFAERHYGDAEGMTVKERLTAFPNRNYPNQENRVSLNNRVMGGLKKINELY